MGEWIAKILSWLGKPGYVLCTVFIFSALVLGFTELQWFTPAKGVIDPYRGWVQVALLASGTGLLVLGLTWMYSRVTGWFRRRSIRKARIEALHRLTVEEQQVLGAYLRRANRTVHWPLDYGVVHSLVNRRLLSRTVNGADFRSYPHDIAEDVWEYLNANPGLVADAGISPHEPGQRSWMSF